MKKRIPKAASRYLILFALAVAFSVVVAHASDETYFNALFACDSNYFSALDDCRATPGFPNNPDEPQCRYNAGDAYVSCLSGIGTPSYELDFCANARAARDNCVNTYLLDNDWDTYYSCWNASGVSQCE
ncbi:MAG TPA: hypothetical protein VIW74_09250 [Pyrinomonadaceae bacterium]|jgi:hypothetical protein